jgi:formylglycine-generating enzyme required for sulfatase activity
MHRLIWEWVDDFNGLFVTVDSRNQGEQKLLETCGAAALSLGDRENYAILMRVALLSALSARDNLESVGFRCARDH